MNEYHKNHRIVMGEKDIWGRKQPFGLSAVDRRQHCYVVGKTGVGKSTLLRNMILQDIAAGAGVGVIDPHGDLAVDLLEHIPARRVREVVYFNPGDLEFPVAFNLLKETPIDQRHLVADGIVAAFKSIWKDSWGPRLAHVLFATVSALLECRNVSLLGVTRMLSDADYRRWVVSQVNDPLLRHFWNVEFAGYDKRFLGEVISPVLNKAGALLLSAPLRNVLGQVRSTIDIPFIMNNRSIFIANLAKGAIGEEKANLLGAVLVTQFQQAAMLRAKMAESDRKDFFLFIDEFHNFSTDSFATILAETRKQRLALTISNQHIEQLSDPIRAAVFGNVGSIVSFRVGEADGQILSRELDGYSPATLSSLGNFEVCAKLLQGGTQAESFLGRTHPPLGERFARSEQIVRYCRERYATPRIEVEDKISRWLGSRPA